VLNSLELVAAATCEGYRDVVASNLVSEWVAGTDTLERDNDYDSRRDWFRDEDLG
jgi:hypothetical protein